jgi:protein involved in polysaccharide export with SLBB domain
MDAGSFPNTLSYAPGQWLRSQARPRGYASCTQTRAVRRGVPLCLGPRTGGQVPTYPASLRTMKNLLLPMFLVVTVVLPRALLSQAGATSSVLSPGDSVRIVVWRSPELSGDFVIGHDGSITHPLYRTVKVAGLPMAAVEANLGRFLATYQSNPQFVIEPLVRVAVSGEVPRPAVFALRPETTVAEAVASAGGLTQFGRRDRVRLVRTLANGAPREVTFDLRNPADPFGSGPVHSGDLILVDRKKNLFRDVVLPVIGLAGSVASLYLFVDRTRR